LDVFCPQCGAHYRVAEADLDTRLKCNDCQTAFLTKTAVGKRPTTNKNARAIAGFAAAAVVIIASFVLIQSMGSRAAATEASKPTAKKAVDLYNDARVKTVQSWIDKVASGETWGIKDGLDMPAQQKRLGVMPQYSYEHASGKVLAQLDEAILEQIKTGEVARLLRDLKCDTAQLADASAATAATGAVRVMMSTRPGDVRYKPGTGEARIDFRMEGSRLLVTGWDFLVRPTETGQRKPRRRRHLQGRPRRPARETSIPSHDTRPLPCP
jgi:hypothetical protein